MDLIGVQLQEEIIQYSYSIHLELEKYQKKSIKYTKILKYRPGPFMPKRG